MSKVDVYKIAEDDVPLTQQVLVTGRLAYIRHAFADPMGKGPAGVNDPLWKDIPANGDFFSNESPGPEGLGTSFKAAVDKDAVYFLIDCPEPKMPELRDKTGSYDPRNTLPRIFTTPATPPMPPVWGDDCMEVYHTPGHGV